MIQIREIINKLESFAPLSLQESYDNCGLQVGNKNDFVDKALLCTDVIEAVIDEAIELNIKLVIAHHPLLFKGLKHITGDSYIERIVAKAIKNDIAIYCAHTNMDKCYGGVSYKMAEKLNLKNIEPLIVEDNNITYYKTGLGCIGELSNSIDAITFLKNIKNIFGVNTIKHTKLHKNKIKTVALCGGSGAEFITTAANKGADIYITADLKYHDFFSFDNQTIIADIGHFESEQIIKEIFYEQLIDFFPNFATLNAISEENPVFYI